MDKFLIPFYAIQNASKRSIFYLFILQQTLNLNFWNLLILLSLNPWNFDEIEYHPSRIFFLGFFCFQIFSD